MTRMYVATGANYGVASVLLGWSKSVCNPKMGIRRLDRPQKLLHSFQGDQHLERTQTSRPAGTYPYIPQMECSRFSHAW
jgi:hypothetical protein